MQAISTNSVAIIKTITYWRVVHPHEVALGEPVRVTEKEDLHATC
jgi:hypothetical protein